MPGKHQNRTSTRDPTRPKSQHLTYFERSRIWTLFFDIGWSKRTISRHLGLSESTIRNFLKTATITPEKQLGRKPNLTSRKRHQLEACATQDAFHCRMPYAEIAQLEGISACRRSLVQAFEKEAYHRRVAKEKPLLTPKHIQNRLIWAQKYKDWTEDMWNQVDWTDEASISTGGFGKIYVTRTSEETYLPSCLIPKFRGYSSWMIHGQISGLHKGPLVVFEKEWGKISSQIYVTHILPSIHRFLKEIESDVGISILMEDNASVHSAKLTKTGHACHGVISMKWPANSPDLNPIENVWRLLKYRIGKRFPKNHEEVRRYIEEEWEKLTVEDFQKYVRSMSERIKAVIEANGGPTRW